MCHDVNSVRGLIGHTYNGYLVEVYTEYIQGEPREIDLGNWIGRDGNTVVNNAKKRNRSGESSTLIIRDHKTNEGIVEGDKDKSST